MTSRTAVAAAFAAGTGIAFLLPASRFASLLPLGLAVVQLFAFASSYRGDRRPEEVFAPAPGIESLRMVLAADEAHGGGRLVRFGRDLPVRPYPISSVLPPSTNVPYQLRDLQGYNALADRALGETLERATGEPLFSWGIWAGRRIVEPVEARSLEHPLLDALAVRAVCGSSLPPARGWAVPCEGRLARNTRARVHARPVGPVSCGFAAIVAADFDPAREVPLGRRWSVGAGGDSTSEGVGTGDVDVVQDSWNRIVARTHASREAVLVVADSFDPDWRATVDGRPAQILPAWGIVRAVVVPAGSHKVELRYRPQSLRLGAALTLLGILAAGWALGLPGNLVRRKRVL